MIDIRIACEADRQPISEVVIAAFGDVHGPEIAALVTDLYSDPSAAPLLSLVATAKGRVIGHVLFTSAVVKNNHEMTCAAILAPLAVHPEFQNQGVGSRLIEVGLNRLGASGVALVFVLGHPGYYPKHGFSPAGVCGLEAPYPIRPENAAAWMVQELHPGIIGDVRGQVICADALNDPKHWCE